MLEQVLSLLKLLPLQLAAKDGSAVPSYSIGEVLTVHTDQTGDVGSREVCPAWLRVAILSTANTKSKSRTGSHIV